MEILVWLIVFGAPVMVLCNLIGHFERKNQLAYEIFCNVIGIPLTLWIDCGAVLIFEAKILYLNFLLPFAAAAYLYMKYSVYGSEKIKNAAKSAALLYASVCAVTNMIYLTFLYKENTSYGGEGHDLALILDIFMGFYPSLVPFNYFVTTVSEVVFQLKGRDIYWKYRKAE